MYLKIYKISFQIFITLVIVYFLASFQVSMSNNAPLWSRMGIWVMFTKKSYYHTGVHAEALIDNKWRDLDLEELYPATWDSGPIYQRQIFRNNMRYMRLFAKNICDRNTEIHMLRIYDISWPVILGTPADYKSSIRKRLNIEWECENVQR